MLFFGGGRDAPWTLNYITCTYNKDLPAPTHRGNPSEATLIDVSIGLARPLTPRGPARSPAMHIGLWGG